MTRILLSIHRDMRNMLLQIIETGDDHGGEYFHQSQNVQLCHSGLKQAFKFFKTIRMLKPRCHKQILA